MISKLIALANKLDQMGLYDEAAILDKIAADLSPEQYKNYYGKDMDKEKHQQWLESQKQSKPEGILDLFQGPENKEVEENFYKVLLNTAFIDLKQRFTTIIRFAKTNNARIVKKGWGSGSTIMIYALQFTNQKDYENFIETIGDMTDEGWVSSAKHGHSSMYVGISESPPVYIYMVNNNALLAVQLNVSLGEDYQEAVKAANELYTLI